MKNSVKASHHGQHRTSAVRGYHHYRNAWFPQESEVLDCYHEFENTFDMFAIKTCKSNGQIAGHLRREISRVTKEITFSPGSIGDCM